MLQRFAWLRRLAIELDARQVKGILHARDVPLEFTPAIGVCRRAMVGGEMPVERGQDTRELVLSRHGRLIPTKRFCVALPLIKEAGTQPVAQLNAAPAVSAAKERVPSPSFRCI